MAWSHHRLRAACPPLEEPDRPPGFPLPSLSLHSEFGVGSSSTQALLRDPRQGCDPSLVFSPFCPSVLQETKLHPLLQPCSPQCSGLLALWTPPGQEPDAVSLACPVSRFGLNLGDMEQEAASVPRKRARGRVSQSRGPQPFRYQGLVLL